mgnify:CR=1 FL=1
MVISLGMRSVEEKRQSTALYQKQNISAVQLFSSKHILRGFRSYIYIYIDIYEYIYIYIYEYIDIYKYIYINK